MSFVSGRFLSDFLNAIAGARVDVDALLGDLPISWSTIPAGQHPLVEWGVFVELMRRLERRVGGPGALEDLGEMITDMKPAPTLRRLAGLSASPLALYRAAQRWALPRALPGLETSLETRADGRIRIVSQIAQSDQACPQIFHVAVGGARALPRILDLPDAAVSAEIGPRRAEFIVLPPPSGTLVARAKRAVRALFSARAALHQLELQQLELSHHLDALRRSFAELEESEVRHRALTEALPDAMVELSAEGRIQFATPSIRELIGYRQDQVVGSNLGLWLHQDDVLQARVQFAATLCDGRMPAGQPPLRARHAQGRWIWIQSSARTFTSHDGDLRVVAILRDASQGVADAETRHQQQTQLEQLIAQRTRQLEQRSRDLQKARAQLRQGGGGRREPS